MKKPYGPHFEHIQDIYPFKVSEVNGKNQKCKNVHKVVTEV